VPWRAADFSAGPAPYPLTRLADFTLSLLPVSTVSDKPTPNPRPVKSVESAALVSTDAKRNEALKRMAGTAEINLWLLVTNNLSFKH